MNHEVHSRSSLFLMEMIISILFFSVASAICIQLFANAHIISDESVNHNEAVVWSQNLAETFYGAHGNTDQIMNVYKEHAVEIRDAVDESTTILFFFDKNWHLIEYPSGETIPEQAQYEALMTISKKSANDVYSDVSTYSSAISEDSVAIAANIVILDIRLVTEQVVDSLPDSEDYIIYSLDTDYYLGREDL